jgi:hypothetical protein
MYRRRESDVSRFAAKEKLSMAAVFAARDRDDHHHQQQLSEDEEGVSVHVMERQCAD